MVWRCGHYSMTLGSPDTPLPLRSPKGTRGASVVLFHSHASQMQLHTFHYPIPLFLYSAKLYTEGMKWCGGVNSITLFCIRAPQSPAVLRIQCARLRYTFGVKANHSEFEKSCMWSRCIIESAPPQGTRGAKFIKVGEPRL